VDVYSGPGAPVTYFLPLSIADASATTSPGEIVARHGDHVVRDAIAEDETCRALLRGMLEGRTLPTALGGRFLFQPAPRHLGSGDLLRDVQPDRIAVRHAGVEQSNSSVIFGQALILKALRRLAAGTNPEIEIPRFLGQYTSFGRVPALVGWAEYQGPDGACAPVGVLQQFIPNQGDGWSYVLREVAAIGGQPALGVSLVSALARLGATLGELHLALASRRDVPDFAPEPFSAADAESWHGRTLASLDEILKRVEHGLAASPSGTGWSDADRRYGEAVRDGAARLRAAIDGIGTLAELGTVKTRHHGDFHLGQTLVTDDGWIIIDFEGEPLRSLAERRALQTPLRDVAGLLRSLDYAHATAVRQSPDADRAGLADLFQGCRAGVLTAYVETVRAGGAPLLPANGDALDRVLVALELEKALYELTYELGNRPDWISIPLSALARMAQTG
jgi:maltose alpha-D-glucosyltransferase / alpha-amylase